jgi:hypothetical protein
MPASSSDALSRAVPLIERLVGFDTESSKSNLPLIEFVEDYLGKLDVPFVRVPTAALFSPDIPTSCRSWGNHGRAIRSRYAARARGFMAAVPAT